MTQDQANKIFRTDLGSQLQQIHVTSDDKPFIRYDEAFNHSKTLTDKLITDFYPEVEITVRESDLRKAQQAILGNIKDALKDEDYIINFLTKI